MKKLIAIALVAALAVAPGCALVVSPVGVGAIFTDVKGPVDATNGPRGSKRGEASATNILGLVATGDASIEAAKNSAGINRITHVDHKSFSVLGLFSTFTTIVWGD